MSDDPYSVLGVKKTATADEIKKAYRKLVRTSHPDLHPDDPGAEARFKAVSNAYDLLRDPDTRARFDAGEIDASGAERPDRRFYRDFADARGHAYQPGHGFETHDDPEDIFADLLRQHARAGDPSARAGRAGHGFRAPGADLRYALEVPFLDAVRGTTTRLTLPGGSTLEVRIPEGTADGQTLRLRGKGAPGYGGGPAGDALITVSVRPHPVFRREGDDIHVTVPVTLDEAVLGAKVPAPTIAGSVSVTVPAGASSGQVLRLRGRGVRRAGGKVPGDQLIEIRIVTPPRIDDALRDFFETWRETHGHDPRKGLFEEAGK